jgi:hypothetical protein
MYFTFTQKEALNAVPMVLDDIAHQVAEFWA